MGDYIMNVKFYPAPTPWTCSKQGLIYSSEQKIIGDLNSFVGPDATFIVRAVNAHEELVYQFTIALKTLGELRGGFEQELSGGTCENIDKIIEKGKQAIAKAEGK